MCRSLNAASKLEPRWPLVPKTTCWAGSLGSGWRVLYEVSSAEASTSWLAEAGFPARSLLMGRSWPAAVAAARSAVVAEAGGRPPVPGLLQQLPDDVLPGRLEGDADAGEP